VIAAPPAGDALAVAALELRLGALPIGALAERLVLVRAVAAVVLLVAQPALGDAAVVGAPEVARLVALGAVLRLLVRVVAAVVLAVAEQPLGDAAVVVVAGTTLPAARTVALSEQEIRAHFKTRRRCYHS